MRHVAVIVTGDRYAKRQHWEVAVYHALKSIPGKAYWVLLHGDCEGIDHIARDIALDGGWHVIPMPYIKSAGRAGGPRRNREMARAAGALAAVGYEVICLAFHDDLAGSHGTKDMTNVALSFGFPVTHYTSDATGRVVKERVR